MFDIGFWEMAFIGVVVLIVVGPERLPGVARTAGHWMGKGRRMLNEVRADIKKEVREHDLQDLRELKQELGSMASGIKKVTDNPDVTGLRETGDQIRKSVDDVSSELKQAGAEIKPAKRATKKTATKKAAAKKTATKKTAAKKTAAKKTAAKKTAAKKTAGEKDGPRRNGPRRNSHEKGSVQKDNDQEGGDKEGIHQKDSGEKDNDQEETGRYGKAGNNRISTDHNQRIKTGHGED